MQFYALLPDDKKLSTVRAEGIYTPLTTRQEVLEVMFDEIEIDLIIPDNFIKKVFGEKLFFETLNLCLYLHSPTAKRISGFTPIDNIESDGLKILLRLVDNPIEFASLLIRDVNLKDLLKTALIQADNAATNSMAIEQQMNTLINAAIESNSFVEDLKRVNAELVTEIEKGSQIINTLFSNLNYIHEIPITAKMLRAAESNEFGNFSFILYFKCLKQNENSVVLAEAVKEMLSKHERMSTRVIVLESVDGTIAYNKLSEKYKSFVSLTEKDYVSSDVKMLGVQARLIKGIMKNPHSRFDCIIIVDNILTEHCIFDNIESLKMERFLITDDGQEVKEHWTTVDLHKNKTTVEALTKDKLTSSIINKIMNRRT